MEVFDLVQTRAACSDGFFRTLHLCVPPITNTKEEGFYVKLFLYVPSPWSWSQKREGHSKQKKKNIYKNRMFFKGYIEICEMAAQVSSYLPI